MSVLTARSAGRGISDQTRLMDQQLSEYNPAWPSWFDREARTLRAALGATCQRIDHVGSTAVPGLVAKPIIDIQVAVPDSAAARTCGELLRACGYTESSAPIHYFHKPSDWPHVYHVHVCEIGSRDEQRRCLFRDWLRAHPADREAYALLKQQLASTLCLAVLAERVQYSTQKTAFIRAIELRAGVTRA